MRRWTTRGTVQKFAKLRQMARLPGSRDLLLNFGTPFISKERLKIQTSNLVCRLVTRGTIQKFAKLGQMGRRPGSRDLLLNFGTPSISKERLKIETSNLVCRLMTRGTIQKFAKLRQMGRPTFKFWDRLCIQGTVEDRNFKFGA